MTNSLSHDATESAADSLSNAELTTKLLKACHQASSGFSQRRETDFMSLDADYQSAVELVTEILDRFYESSRPEDTTQILEALTKFLQASLLFETSAQLVARCDRLGRQLCVNSDGKNEFLRSLLLAYCKCSSGERAVSLYREDPTCGLHSEVLIASLTGGKQLVKQALIVTQGKVEDSALLCHAYSVAHDIL